MDLLTHFLTNGHALLPNAYAFRIAGQITKKDHFTDFLGAPLDHYAASHWPKDKVRILRANQREGLIRTRLIGARNATGEVRMNYAYHRLDYLDVLA